MRSSMNVYGLQIPEKKIWIKKIEKYLQIEIFPMDILFLITEYGSSLKLQWLLKTNFKKQKIHANGIDDLTLFSNKNFLAIGKEHFKGQLTSHIDNLYVDLLNDNTWHIRRKAIYHIFATGCLCTGNECPNRFPQSTRLPRDAYIICSRLTDDVLENITDEPNAIIVTMHKEEVVHGKLTFHSHYF